MRASDKPPSTIAEWVQFRSRMRERLTQAWGGFPVERCDLQPRKLGELRRDGYRVEKIAFRTRPGTWMTSNAYVPERPGRAVRKRAILEEKVLGGTPRPSALNVRVVNERGGESRTLMFAPEPGLTLTARQEFVGQPPKRLAVLLDLAGAENVHHAELPLGLARTGWSVVTMDLRATGKLTTPEDARREIPDYRSSEWALWIGRPLLGQWRVDVKRLLDALAEPDSSVIANQQATVHLEGASRTRKAPIRRTQGQTCSPAGAMSLCPATDQRPRAGRGAVRRAEH